MQHGALVNRDGFLDSMFIAWTGMIKISCQSSILVRNIIFIHKLTKLDCLNHSIASLLNTNENFRRSNIIQYFVP